MYKALLKQAHDQGVQSRQSLISFDHGDGEQTAFKNIQRDAAVCVRHNESYLSVKLMVLLPTVHERRPRVSEIPRLGGRGIVGGTIHANRFFALVVKVRHDEVFVAEEDWKWAGVLGAEQQVGIKVDNKTVVLEVLGLDSGNQRRVIWHSIPRI